MSSSDEEKENGFTLVDNDDEEDDNSNDSDSDLDLELDSDNNDEDDDDRQEEGQNSDSEEEIDDEEKFGDAEESIVVETETAMSKKKKKKLKKSLKEVGLPAGLRLTPKLINQLTETEKLYQSNLYKFQIQELLQEIAVPAKTRSKMDKWCTDFNAFLQTLKSSKVYNSFDDCEKWLGDVKVPLPEHILPKEGSKFVFNWVNPEATYQIGSWANQLNIDKLSVFDIAVQIPRECLNNSDYVNHKYHVKRALYLTYLAIQLKKRGDEISFICPDGNPLKPALQIVVSEKKSLKVRIHCVPPRDLFKLSKFSPDKNNVRYKHLFGVPKPEDGLEYSTPNYNTSILSDVLFVETNEFIKATLSRNENFCQALKLLKIWLQQRSLNQGFGAFSNFILTMLMCYLVERKKINNNMSSYQIIRIFFVFILQTELTTKAITFSAPSVADAADAEKNIQAWFLQYDIVFLNSTNELNYTANMSTFTYNRVKIEAKLALDILNTSKVTGFQSMFITKVPFLLNFDHVLQIKVNEALISRLQADENYKSHFLNYSSYFYPIGVSLIAPLIEKCLKQRLQVLDIEFPPLQEWDITSSPTNTQVQVIRFGLVTNREFAFKLVEKCESEEESATKQFKELWKEKSILRRFRDGSMLETVTFEDVDEVDKSRICFLMLKYILETHLEIKIKDSDYLDNQLEKISEPHFEMVKLVRDENEDESGRGPPKKKLKRRNQRLTEIAAPISLDEITNFASTSFDHLSKILRQLDAEGLPLAITSVQGTSSILRFSNFYPTPPQTFYSSALLTEEMGSSLIIRETSGGEALPKLPKHVEPIGVVVQLEGSGKWPDNISAIERLKCAFLIRIGQLLKDQFDLCVQTHPRFLDVLKDGFVFRIKLTYYRELILLKQLRDDGGMLRIRDNPKSLSLEKSTLLLPQLTSTLHAFNQQFGAFGKTCRLAKRWIASHLLMAGVSSIDSSGAGEMDYRFTEESIELIVAHLFLQYAPHLTCPNEAQVGFLRFLEFIATTNWKSTSIIVNFNDKLTKDEVDSIESEFVKKRDTLPLLFIASPEDKLGSVWTKHLMPNVLFRAAGFAKQALDLLQNQLTTVVGSRKSLGPNLTKIFSSDLSNFDALIRIKKNMNPRKGQGLDALTQSESQKNKLMFKEYVKRPEELMPIVDFDPVQIYLEELREAFNHLAVFLHDQFGGGVIAVIWRREALQDMEFKITNAKGRVAGLVPKTVSLKIESTAKLFETMGKGLVESVEICRKESQV